MRANAGGKLANTEHVDITVQEQMAHYDNLDKSWRELTANAPVNLLIQPEDFFGSIKMARLNLEYAVGAGTIATWGRDHPNAPSQEHLAQIRLQIHLLARNMGII